MKKENYFETTISGEWFERHEGLVWKAVHDAAPSNAIEPEDLFQDACVAIVRAYPKFNHDRNDARLTTYLYQVALNAVRMRFREQKALARGANVKTYSLEDCIEWNHHRRVVNSTDEYWGESCLEDFLPQLDEDRYASTEGIAIQKLAIDDLLNSLKHELDPLEYSILTKLSCGYSQDVIAKEEGLSQPTISKYVQSARKKARKMINR